MCSQEGNGQPDPYGPDRLNDGLFGLRGSERQERLSLLAFFEQFAAVLAHRSLKRTAQETENGGQVEIDNDLVVENIYAAIDLLSGSGDEKVHPVLMRPIGLDRCHSGWKIAANLMPVSVHPATHFL